MFFRNPLFVLAALSSCVYSSTSGQETSRTIEKIESAPAGWTKDESAKLDKDESLMKLRIHLVHQDMDKFHEMAMNVRMTISWIDAS